MIRLPEAALSLLGSVIAIPAAAFTLNLSKGYTSDQNAGKSRLLDIHQSHHDSTLSHPLPLHPKKYPQHQADRAASWLSRRRVMGVLLVAACRRQPEQWKVHLLGCFPSALVCGQYLAQQRMLGGTSGSRSQARSSPTPGLPYFAGDALHERDPSVVLCLDRATNLKSVCQAMQSRYTRGTKGQSNRAPRKISSGRRIRLPPLDS